MSSKLSAACAWLGALLVIFVVAADRSGQVQAQAAQETFTVYLPLIKTSGTPPEQPPPPPPPPAGTYGKLLARAAAACPSLGLDQLCVVGGQVEITPKGGQAAPAAAGTKVDLAAVERVALSSSGDMATWGVALLRLRSGAPDQSVSALALGTLSLTLTPLGPGVAAADAPSMPALQLASQPVAGATAAGSSGLVVSGPSADDLVSLEINGAAVTVGGSALVEAAGGKLTTTAANGGIASVEIAEASSTATQGQQVEVALDASGKASGTPSAPRAPLLTMWVLDDLLIPILNDEQRVEYAAEALARLNRSIDRCVAGKATYVYNVLFWARAIEREPLLKSHMDPAKLAAALERAPNCLSFDLDLDSTVGTVSEGMTEQSHLKANSISVSFRADGSDFISVDTNLDYVSYTMQSANPCAISLPTTDGRVELADAELRIAGNRVRVKTRVGVSKLPTEQIIISCPIAPPIVIDKHHWVPVFFRLHDDIWQRGEIHSFDFREWRYTAASAQCSAPNGAGGCEHFAEAIYTREATEGAFAFSGTTFLNLIHSPMK